ncbi:MAG: glycosyltransferase WbuB [Myxococcales bacterium]|nr:glycosyltransferase WbuB [Myxococcales bacterium]
MPRLVFVSEAFPPDIAGSGVTVATVAVGLARDYTVRAIVGAADFTGTGTAAPRRESWQGIDVVRCPTLGIPKNRVWQRAARVGVVATTMTATVAREVAPGDIVFVVVAPGVMAWAAVQAARVRGARVVLLVYDVFPESLVPAGLAAPGSPQLRALQALYHPVYGQVDAIVTLGRCMAAKVRELGGPRTAPVSVALHWADLDLVQPSPLGTPTLRDELGLGDRCVFLFAGNLGRVQGLDTVVEAMVQLRAVPKIIALFVGAGAGEAPLRAVVARHGLANVVCSPMRPREQQAYVLGAADVGLVTLSPGVAGLGIPGKTPNLLAAGKPVLLLMDAAAETAQLVDEERCGWVTPPGDASALAACMRHLAASPAEVAAAAARARRVAERRYSMAGMLDTYRALVARLGG